MVTKIGVFMPTLSVITPVYNGEKYVQRCYRNLLDQIYTDWEWVVVNDGSSDSTLKELSEISDSRVRIITYANNMGRGYARQQAIDSCLGDWMVIWDIDDLNFPTRLSKINEAKESGYDFFCSYSVVCDNELNIKGIRGFIAGSHGISDSFVHPTMACRLEVAKTIGYDSTVRTGEDGEILWVLPSNYRGLWYDRALVIYQEDREINLQKAIDCNHGHLKLLTKLYTNKIISMTISDFIYWFIKYNLKLFVMYLLKLQPDLYLKSVKHRSYGVVNPQYELTEDELIFIQQYTE